MEVFYARVTLAGYYGAGKTSTATRLMGETLDVEKSHSTEGIAMHKIKLKLKGGKWEKTKPSTEDLWKDFTCGVLAKIQEKSNGEILHSSEVPANLVQQKKNKFDHSQATQGAESFKTSSPNESSSKAESEATKIRPMQERTKQMLRKHGLAIRNKESDADTPFGLTLWDLGGQNEFMVMHHIFLNVESTTLIVMDITKELDECIGERKKLDYLNTTEEVLHYWLNSLHIEAVKKNLEPNVALILTRKDMIEEDGEKWKADYIKSILKSIQGTDYANYVTDKNIFAGR